MIKLNDIIADQLEAAGEQHCVCFGCGEPMGCADDRSVEGNYDMVLYCGALYHSGCYLELYSPLEVGLKVLFNFGNGLDIGEAIITAREPDEDDEDNFLYQLDVVSGSQADMHRNKDGQLFANAFEVTVI